MGIGFTGFGAAGGGTEAVDMAVDVTAVAGASPSVFSSLVVLVKR